MNQKSNITFNPHRFYLVLFVLVLAVFGLIARVFDLTILDQHFLRQQGDERVLRLVKTPPFRGMIMDRNGFPLAVSTTVFSVWMNPKEFEPTKKQLAALSRLLSMKTQAISTIMKPQTKKREFLYLKRGLPPALAKEIKALNIPGLYLQEEYRRFYPEGEIAAHVIGFTNVDDKGQEGLELAYNEWLEGEQGKKWVIKDRLGRVISEVRTVQEQKAGHDLTLSIDRRVQYLAYRELLASVTENEAVSGSVIVLDVKTGEILAMVNQPSFNPNNRAGTKIDNLRNRAVTDTFEPGSTIKTFTVLSGLESGRYKPDTIVDIAPGWVNIDHRLVKEEHYHGDPLLTVTKILEKSSNVGAAKMVLSLPANFLWEVLHRVGLGETTAVGFPGEQSGSLVKHAPWGEFVLATYSFGYGMSVTPLQLAQAYSVIANQGIKIPVSLIRVEKPPAGKRVLNAKAVKEMISMLEGVIYDKDGTGKKARVSGYRVAGKTGTSRLLGATGYMADRHNASFIGMAPASDPRFIVAVIISDPRGKHYYGAEVAAPVFEKVMGGTLRIYGVSPDKVS